MLAVAWCGIALGPTAPPVLTFEVASIKPSPPPGSGPAIAGILGGPGSRTPGLERGSNVSLRNFIIRAFQLSEESRISGPDWLGDTKFDMNARVPDGTTTQQQVNLMLQSMLAERFGLRFHYETREVSGFNLVVAKGGAKLTTAAKTPESPDGSVPSVPPGTLDKNGFPAINPIGPDFRGVRGANHDRWVRQTIGQFAEILSGLKNRPVVDATGLKGEYDFEMYYVYDCPRRPDCENGIEIPGVPTTPTIDSALEQQLGLKLVPVRNVPTRILVVDHIERAPTPD